MTLPDMKEHFTRLAPADIPGNVFRMIGDEWMLITAGDPSSFNMMTASWGSMGVLWDLPVALCYVRPQRYTFGFMERSEYYTLSFFRESDRKILDFCGARSGRKHDKVKETGLVPFFTERGAVGYEQARLILECRKLYADDLRKDQFIGPSIIGKNYRKGDFHRFFIGEVTDVYFATRGDAFEVSK